MERGSFDWVDSATTYDISDLGSTSRTSIDLTDQSMHASGASTSSLETSRNNAREDPACLARKRSSTSSSSDKRTATKICRVCGDKAYSYNFNVITCESCKAFFRRNANKEKEIRCPFNNRCEINIVSRRFCQRCRLQKCFNVGMKKEWIMSEEARLEKKQRVQENRERRLAEAAGVTSYPKKTSKSIMDNKPAATTTPDTLQAVAGAPSQPTASLLSNLPVLPAETMPLGLPNPAAAAAAAAAVGDVIAQNAAAAAAAVTAPFPAAATLPPGPAFRSSLSDPVPGLPAAAAAAGAFLANPEHTMVNQMAQQVQMAQAQLQQAAQIEQQLQQHVAAQQIVQHQAAQLAAAQAQQQQLAAAAAVVAAAKSLAPQKPLSAAAVPPQSSMNVATQLESLNKQFTQLGQCSQHVVGADATANDEVVTIPKDVFVHLVDQKHNAVSATALMEESRECSQKCVCTCQCGKYQAGKLIVDEILAELGSCVGNNLERDELMSSDSYEVSPVSSSGKQQPEMADGTAIAKEEIIDVDSTSTPEQKTFFSPEEEDEFNKNSPENADLCFMTTEDQNRLDEVRAANRIWAEMDGIDIARHQQGCPTKLEMVNMADGAIRRMIKMVKTIEQFRKMDDHDQIQLLKNSCMEYIILRGAMSYDPVQNSWIGPTPHSGYTVRMDAMKDTQSNLFENSIRFYTTFKEEWRTNENVMLILGMLVIFNPEFPNLHNRDAIKEENRQYKRVLKRLLFSLCNQNHKRTIIEMKGLLDSIENLKYMNVRAQRMLHEVDENLMEPLLLEIFGH